MDLIAIGCTGGGVAVMLLYFFLRHRIHNQLSQGTITGTLLSFISLALCGCGFIRLLPLKGFPAYAPLRVTNAVCGICMALVFIINVSQWMGDAPQDHDSIG